MCISFSMNYLFVPFTLFILLAMSVFFFFLLSHTVLSFPQQK